jgi:hypothetical protein
MMALADLVSSVGAAGVAFKFLTPAIKNTVALAASQSFPPLTTAPILAASGVAKAAVTAAPSALPLLISLPLQSQIFKMKVILSAAFFLNMVTVTRPGRIDREIANAMREEEGRRLLKSKGVASNTSNAFTPATGKSYITPSGYAFAIWGLIYLGEGVFTSSFVLTPMKFFGSPAGSFFSIKYGSLRLVQTIALFLPHWVNANITQAIWCFAFRSRFHTPAAKKSGGPFVSALMLGLTAVSLSKVAFIANAQAPLLSLFEQATLLPLVIHFGWMTAATLVNINGALANYSVDHEVIDKDDAGKNKKKKLITVNDALLFAGGKLSVCTAFLASIFVTYKGTSLSTVNNAATGGLLTPTYPLVIAWALVACADGMNKRMSKMKKVAAEEGREVDSNLYEHAATMEKLSFRAAVLGTMTSFGLMIASKFDFSSKK